MRFKPNPLLYAATRDFYSSFKLTITMSDTVDHAVLSRAVAVAMTRYPYFTVTPEKVGESLLLAFNPRPVPVLADGRSAVLGSEAQKSGQPTQLGFEDLAEDPADSDEEE